MTLFIINTFMDSTFDNKRRKKKRHPAPSLWNIFFPLYSTNYLNQIKFGIDYHCPFPINDNSQCQFLIYVFFCFSFNHQKFLIRWLNESFLKKQTEENLKYIFFTKINQNIFHELQNICSETFSCSEKMKKRHRVYCTCMAVLSVLVHKTWDAIFIEWYFLSLVNLLLKPFWNSIARSEFMKKLFVLFLCVCKFLKIVRAFYYSIKAKCDFQKEFLLPPFSEDDLKNFL